MKRLLFLFAIIIYSKCYTQTSDSTEYQPLIAYWEKGDVIHFTITKTVNDSIANKTTQTKEYIHKSSIIVVDSTDSSYVLKYIREVDLDFLDNESIKFFSKNTRETIEKLTKIEILYETTETGQFKYVLNEEEIISTYRSVFDLIFKDMTKIVKDKAERQQITNVFTEIKNRLSKETLIDNYAQELNLLHYPLGLEWNVSDTTFYEDEIPIPLIDLDLKANAAIYCAELNTEDDYIVLIDEKILDGDMFAYGLQKFMKEMKSKAENTTNKNIDENFGMSIFLKNIYTFNISYGCPLMVTSMKEMEFTNENEQRVRTEVLTISFNQITTN